MAWLPHPGLPVADLFFHSFDKGILMHTGCKSIDFEVLILGYCEWMVLGVFGRRVSLRVVVFITRSLSSWNLFNRIQHLNNCPLSTYIKVKKSICRCRIRSCLRSVYLLALMFRKIY